MKNEKGRRKKEKGKRKMKIKKQNEKKGARY
jgi:hypothetical protein